MQTFGQSQISKGKKGQRQGRDQEHEVQQQQQQQHAQWFQKTKTSRK